MLENNIRFWRRYRDITQIALANILGCAPSTISYYEHGYYKPDPEMRIKIAVALEVSEDELFSAKLIQKSAEQFTNQVWQYYCNTEIKRVDEGILPIGSSTPWAHNVIILKWIYHG